MIPIEEIRTQILHSVPGAEVELVPNKGPSGQHSLLIDAAHAEDIARFLRDDPELRMDFCSNATGVDWPETAIREKATVREEVDGVEQEVEKQVERVRPGFLEAVYHLFSMSRKHGPLVLRLRTANRTDQVELPSLTPVWRSAELQEREMYDLYGIVFKNHPDLRRLLMWDEFEGHPMRKDYVPPEDDEDREPFTPNRTNDGS